MFTYKTLYSLGKGPGDKPGDIANFRRVAREGFNISDMPDTRFFKLFFYFFNEDEGDTTTVEWYNGGSTGLLAPTWLEGATGSYYKYNSAWAYLMNNYEHERADILQQFINLLSQISSDSPWYFNQISGVDEALAREGWEVPAERKHITINCLDDSVDHRIESLLSMYRSIVWSHTRKCEVLPANLRKFDMGLFVFSGLIDGLGAKPAPPAAIPTGVKQMVGIQEPYDWVSIGGNGLSANYKYIEFHNCEISMDSLKSGYNELNNGEGTKQVFNIDIYFDDCYEKSFNPFILREFGDFYIWDNWTATGRDADKGVALGTIPEIEDPNTVQDEIDMSYRLNAFEYGGNTAGTRADRQYTGNIFATANSVGGGSFKDTLKNTINNTLSRMGDEASRLGREAAAAAKGLGQSIQNSAINAVTGGLGNIYGQGMGMLGSTNSIADTAIQQVQTLTNIASGNVNSLLTGASRTATQTATQAVNKTITEPFEGWGDNHFTNGKSDLGNLYGEKQQINTSRTLRNNL